MKNIDIEKLLRDSADKFVPDVLPSVMKADIAIDNSFVDGSTIVKPHKAFRLKLALSALSFVVVIAFSLLFFAGYMLQDSETIYLEVNPSIELVTNRYGNVKTIKYLNADAETIFVGYDVEGQGAEDVADLFVELCYDNGYLTAEESTIYISVLSKNDKSAEKALSKLKSRVENCLNENNVNRNVVTNKVTSEEKAKATESGISVAKNSLINEIIAIDGSYTFDLLKDKTMKELKDILSECRQQKEPGGGNQNGAPTGKGRN